MIACEFWDLARPAIPPRSRLYHLEPIGVGTAAVESLTGYVTRLAEVHGVRVRTLVVHELLPLLGRAHLSKRVDSSLTAFWQKDARALNSMRLLARDWVQALETLTGRRDLRFLTMLTWSEVLSSTRLLRLQRAWCPACYEEWCRAGQVVYEPLVWALQAVVTCPRHHRPLQQQCPHADCHQSQTWLAPRARPGYCSRCERWLGLPTESALPEDERLEQKWAADVVGELVAAAPGLPTPPRREQFREAICAYVQQVGGGKGSVFARAVQVSECSVSSWMRGTLVPELGYLLQVCQRVGTSPRSLLMDDSRVLNVLPRNAEGWNEPAHKPRTPRKRFDAEAMQRALEAVLASDETPPPAMREVARRLGRAHSELHVHFRDLCRSISARYLAYCTARGLERRQQICGEIREAVFRVHAQSLYPSANRVAMLLSAPGFIRHVNGIAVWHEALRDLGWEK